MSQLVEPVSHSRGDASSCEGILQLVEEVVVPTKLGKVSEGEVDGPGDGPGEAQREELGSLAVST